jgi:lipoyl(octanoyl) transferase
MNAPGEIRTEAEARLPGLPPLWVVRLGIVPYEEAVVLQERVLHARRLRQIPDVLLLLEHPPVITMGRGARAENLLVDPAVLAAEGIQVTETARGGDVTYHGPGQIVGYPILDLTEQERDVHRYLRVLEESLIRTLARFELRAERSPGLTGVWVGRNKVAAIGIGVRHWITWHGFALNVTTSLDAFTLIVPCGIREQGRGVTSLERLLGREISDEEVIPPLIEEFAALFHRRPVLRAPADLCEALSGCAAGLPLP